MTRVTIALPVYNGMPYLTKAVESILGQTYSDFRFVIINDGSTDTSAKYLDSIKDRRVTVIHQENKGQGAAANRTFELCETEFYARIDADDVSLPERLKEQLTFMEEHKDIVLLGTQVAFIVGQRIFPASGTPTEHNEIIKLLLRGKPVICQSAIMLRTDAVRKIGGYRLEGAGEDFDFFLRMSEVGRVANLNQVLHYYRMHLGSVVATKHNENRRGIAYAIECSRCRRNGKPEPTLDDFKRSWLDRGLLQRAGDAIDRWSGIQYRKALLDFSEARAVRGVIKLACAAACRPGTTMRHVFTRVLRK